MARLSRIEAVGEPHHVLQRGNRRQSVFFSDGDKEAYLNILGLQVRLFSLEVWAYCLMDNHVHLIVVPHEKGSLTEGIAETHRAYTRSINFRQKWRGYLWQGRFKSFPLDEKYLYAAVRYVECNPVRAGMTKRAEEYPWSSAGFHVRKEHSPLLSHFYLLDDVGDWAKYLDQSEEEKDLKIFRRHGATGRPLGEIGFLRKLETQLGRVLIKQKPGPKK